MELEELGEPEWAWQSETDRELQPEEPEPAWVDAYES